MQPLTMGEILHNYPRQTKNLKPSLGRRCVETELTLVATEKSATDGDRSVTTLWRHKRPNDRIELVADRKYPVAESRLVFVDLLFSLLMTMLIKVNVYVCHILFF